MKLTTNICDMEKNEEIGNEFIKDDHYTSLSSQSLLKPARMVKELWRICRSRTELNQIWTRYKWFAFSSVIAIIGLVISIRMVGLNEIF